MPTLSQRKRSFQNRVAYAQAGLLRGERSRQFDSCFEIYDGEYVVTALMRQADKNPLLKEAITRRMGPSREQDWETLPWQETARCCSRFSDAFVATLAAYKQIEEEWRAVNLMLPQLEAVRDPGHQTFTVIRREGCDEITECFHAKTLRDATKAVASWTDRTILGAPFLGLFAEVDIKSPEGDSYRFWPKLPTAEPPPRQRLAAKPTLQPGVCSNV